MNPFELIAGIFNGGREPTSDPWNTQVQGPDGTPPAPYPQATTPPLGGAQNGPFGPGTSLIGTPLDWLLGPSASLTGQRERLAHDYGVQQQDNASMAAVLQRTAQIRDENPGAPSNMIWQRLLSDPVMMQHGMRTDATKLMNAVKQTIEGTQAAPPNVVNMSPGQTQMLRDPHTGQPVPGSGMVAPTAEMQNFGEFQRLTPEQQQAYMAFRGAGRSPQLTTYTDSTGQQQRAIVMTDETGNRVMIPMGTGGAFPGVSPGGGGLPTATGPAVRPGQTPPPTGGPGTVVPPAGPAVTPPAGPPAGGPPAGPVAPPAVTPPPGPTGTVTPPAGTVSPTQGEAPFDPNNPLPNRAEMFLAAGAVGQATSAISGVTGNIAPRYAAPVTAARRNALDQYTQAVQNLFREGRPLAREADVIGHLLPRQGATTNPIQEMARSLQMRTWLEQRRALAETVINDLRPGQQSVEARRKAIEERNDIDRALLAFPEKPQMVELFQNYQQRGGIASDLRELWTTIPTRDRFEEIIREVSPAGEQRPGQERPGQPEQFRPLPSGWQGRTPDQVIELLRNGQLSPEDRRRVREFAAGRVRKN